MSEPEKHTITSYKWEEKSVVPLMELTGNVAYLHDSPDADPEALSKINQFLKEKGWNTGPANREGKPVLRLSNFDQEELLAFVQEQNFVLGKPEVTVTEKIEKQNFGDWLKSTSMRASGVFYEIGNVIYMIEGWLRKDEKGNRDWAGIGVGAAFTLGDAALMFCGKDNSEKAGKSLITKLRKEMEKSGIEIPEGAAINVESMAKPMGFLEKSYDFIRNNPHTIKAVAEFGGGGFMIASGLRNKNPPKVIAGWTILLGFLASQLIQEKKIDREDYAEASTREKLGMKIQSNPLVLGGISGLANNALNVGGYLLERNTMLKRPEADREHHYRIGLSAVCSMLLANSLFAISKQSRGHDDGTNPIFNDLYSMAAEVLQKQPESVRNAALKIPAEILGSRTEIKENKMQAEERLIKEMELLTRNNWFQKEYGQQHAAAGMALS